MNLLNLKNDILNLSTIEKFKLLQIILECIHSIIEIYDPKNESQQNFILNKIYVYLLKIFELIIYSDLEFIEVRVNLPYDLPAHLFDEYGSMINYHRTEWKNKLLFGIGQIDNILIENNETSNVIIPKSININWVYTSINKYKSQTNKINVKNHRKGVLGNINKKTAQKILQKEINTIEESINKMKKSNDFIKLQDCEIGYSLNPPTITFGNDLKVFIPIMTKEEAFCKAMFKRLKNEPVDWSIIYEEMTSEAEPQNTKKDRKMIKDTMQRINNKIKNITNKEPFIPA